MSNDVVISVENLSKRYLVGHQGTQESYHSLRDTLVRHGRNFARKTMDMARGRQIVQGDEIEEFWALKDVSFEVKRGEVLGIIGRNGAGKSTLLKILSRITEPTNGKVILNGRVASLLEVGTGFHPELTGRENIFLNGAILGMSKVEIHRKFSEIVEFSGVEKFLDTPVKRYSSGMYVRLAFAVAAHLESEILIVDEVLAVGDYEFQKMCLGRMRDVADSGRTVLFVSHNMGAIRSFCDHSILLEKGKLTARGETDSILSLYSKKPTSAGYSNNSQYKSKLLLKNIEINDSLDKTEQNCLVFSETYFINFTIESSDQEISGSPLLLIRDANGILVSSICGPEEGIDFHCIYPNKTYSILIATMNLFPGTYYVDLYVYGLDREPLLAIDHVLEFEVIQSAVKNAKRSYRGDHGVVRISSEMKLQ